MHTRRLTWRFFVVLLLFGCGGGTPTESRDPVVPIEPDPVLTSMTIVLPSDTLVAGTTYQADVAALDQKSRVITVASIAWASANALLLRTASDGTLLALAEGTVRITATVGSVTATRALTILPIPPGPVPVATVQVTPFDAKLDIGASLQLTAALRDFAGRVLSGRTVEWKSNDESIAVVSSDGAVTGLSSGTTTIEAISETRVAAAQVTVVQPLDTSVAVTVGAPLAGSTVNDTITIAASARGDAAIDSVIATTGTLRAVLEYRVFPPPKTSGIWIAVVDLSSLPVGPTVLVVTAYDVLGRRGVTVVPIVHNSALISGGGKSPGGSK